ncbi:ThuA domain-containing protein [uncultured Croceitalea sp.]|uniref:ThuA domain-containing protein n=1 Tax=uncultured Croceitalea sp. TaxID=1798908 RepID=UPI00374E59E8
MKSTYLPVAYFLMALFLFSCSNSEPSFVEENNEEQVDDEPVDEENSSDRNKVLVFTKTSGFNHNTKEESVAMVQKIADELDFDVEVSDNASVFDDQNNINSFDVIFFTNTSGNMLNASQRNTVESYAEQGGNFISNHAASDSYGHSSASTVNGGGKGEWDWYAENITGCSVRNDPNHTSNNFAATVTIQNQNLDLTAEIRFPWDDNEEWYYWEGGYINDEFTELLRVSDTGSNSYDDSRMTAHYWERPEGGISFYSSMGHAKSKYSNPEFIILMQNAFEFILK